MSQFQAPGELPNGRPFRQIKKSGAPLTLVPPVPLGKRHHLVAAMKKLVEREASRTSPNDAQSLPIRSSANRSLLEFLTSKTMTEAMRHRQGYFEVQVPSSDGAAALRALLESGSVQSGLITETKFTKHYFDAAGASDATTVGAAKPVFSGPSSAWRQVTATAIRLSRPAAVRSPAPAND